jgi:hypothetical protein
MNRLALALLCLPLVAACSAEIALNSPPIDTTVPVTSAFEPTYVEVAIDLPEGTQGLDITVKEATASLTVVNPSKVFTLNASLRLSLTGTASPDQPPIIYTPRNLPPYYASSQELLSANFEPDSSREVLVPSSETFTQAVRQPRIWFIVSNTISKVGSIPVGALPVEIQLKNAILHVTVGKEFRGLEGALGVGGL